MAVTIKGFASDWAVPAPAQTALNALYNRRSDFALTPLAHGAVGDGTTDDRVALDATLTAATAGGTIDLGGRTYNTGTGLTIGKTVTIRNGGLTAVDNRVALVNAPGIRLENVKITRTGTARSGSFDSAITVNAEKARLVDVEATTTIGDALHLANGTCNGTVVEGGHYETSDPNNFCGIQLRSGGTHNYDIRISRARIRNTGYGTAIGFYNCSRCTVEHCDIRGIRRSPWFTVTGWTLVSGTSYRALDRTDTASNAVYVNGTEYRKNSDPATTTPAQGYYTAPGDGYLYLNAGQDPSTLTVTTTRTNGYGILMYATSSEALGMRDNLMAHNYVEDTDGFGLYYQTLQNVPRNNRTLQNTLRNVCKLGIAVNDLPFAGIGVFGGLDVQLEGDHIDGAGSAEYPCPGVDFKSTVGVPHMTGTLIGVSVQNATGKGIQLSPGTWHMSGVKVTDSGSHGVGVGTTVTGDILNVTLEGVKSISNTGDGANFETSSTAELRLQFLGGLYSGNVRNILLSRCRDVFIGGGIISEWSSNYGIVITGTCQRVVVDGVFQRSGQGLQILAGIADLTVGTVISDTSSGTKVNIAGPYKVMGATGYGTTWRCKGTPEGAITAVVGSTALRLDGGAGTTFYVKETGTGNTGWVAK